MANPLEEQRLRNLEAIVALGRNPYGSRLERSGALGELAARATPLAEGELVENIAAVGRIMAIRSFGKAAFLELRDRTGRLQAYVRKNSVSAEDFAVFEKLDTGDHIRVTGSLGKSKTGEPTIFCASLDIVSKALLPPPEKWHGLRDVETRYRKRYVDLFNSPEVMARFLARSAIIDGLRRFFVGHGFVEVETPMMQDIAGGAAARPFVTHHNALDMDLFLRVAPEIPLKKLLVGGMERVFEINRNFRNEGIDTRHHPEFTMMEAYQAYGNYEVMMELTEGAFCELLELVKTIPNVEPCEALRNMTRPWPRRRYADLIREHAGVDPADEAALRAKAAELALPVPPGAHKDVIADEIFGALVEPTLKGPVFVTHQPLSLTPLAKAAPGEPDLAERFELYIEHIECANAYTELNDPVEQEKRFHAQIDQGQGEHRVVDESFVDALKYGMPPAGGLGIGVDRMVMMLTDTHAIRDVILFPLLRRAEG